MMQTLVQCMALGFLLAVFGIAISTSVGHMKALITGGDDRHMLGWIKYGFLAAVAFVGVTLNLAQLLGWS